MTAHVISLCINPVYALKANGRLYHFEWHDIMGPTAVTKKGDAFRNWPFRETHPFWAELERWIRAGSKVDAQGNCLMEPAQLTGPVIALPP